MSHVYPIQVIPAAESMTSDIASAGTACMANQGKSGHLYNLMQEDAKYGFLLSVLTFTVREKRLVYSRSPRKIGQDIEVPDIHSSEYYKERIHLK